MLRHRLGFQGPTLVGLGLSVAGFAWLSTVSVSTTEAGMLLPLALCGIGSGIANAGVTTPGVLSEPLERLNEAAGLMSLTRFFGSALALAIGTSTYLTVSARLPDALVGSTGQAPTQIAVGGSVYRDALVALGQDLRTPFVAATQAQTVEAFTTTMRTTAVAVLGLTVISGWLLAGRSKR